MGKITFVPVGGLANRMQAIASAVTLAEKVEMELSILWFKDWALCVPFHRLFMPLDHGLVSFREASRMDYILLDRPRQKNFYLPKLYQHLRFRARLYERSILPLRDRHFDFASWAMQHRNVYMASYVNFLPYDYSRIHRLFVPVEEIRREVERRCLDFFPKMTGVHIRRTDNVAAIRQSPIELFFAELDKEMEDADAGIYLATDSEEVKASMKKRYGSRLICVGRQADRTTLAGIQDGVADMYTLARTQKIYGSFHSSFSELAAQISGVPLKILRLP